jgi:hypothetical protein
VHPPTHSITVSIYGPDDEPDLLIDAIADTSPVVYAHHVVNQPQGVRSRRLNDEDGDLYGYEWRLRLSTREGALIGLYERLAGVADACGTEVIVSPDDGSIALSYRAGDRAHFAAMQAARGIA